jgi:hypothetical protein
MGGRYGFIIVFQIKPEATAKGQIGFELRGRVKPGCSIHLASARKKYLTNRKE